MGIYTTGFDFEIGPRHLEEMPLLCSEAAFFSEILLKLTDDLLLKCLFCKVGQVSCYFVEKIPHIRQAVAFSMLFYCTVTKM